MKFKHYVTTALLILATTASPAFSGPGDFDPDAIKAMGKQLVEEVTRFLDVVGLNTHLSSELLFTDTKQAVCMGRYESTQNWINQADQRLNELQTQNGSPADIQMWVNMRESVIKNTNYNQERAAECASYAEQILQYMKNNNLDADVQYAKLEQRKKAFQELCEPLSKMKFDESGNVIPPN